MRFLDKVNSFNFLGNKVIQEATNDSGSDAEIIDKVTKVLSEVTGDLDSAKEEDKNQIFNNIRFFLENITQDLIERSKSDPSFQKLLLMLLDPERVKWIKEYLKHTNSIILKNKELNSPEKLIQKIEDGDIPDGFGEEFSLITFRLSNLKELILIQPSKTKESDDLLNDVDKELEEEKIYLAELIETVDEYIEKGEESEKEDRLSKLVDAQNKMYELFAEFIKSQTESKKKDTDSKKDSSSGFKKERYNKIKNILNVASLPIVTQGKIETDGNGDFYLLFKKLQSKYANFSDNILKNSVYSSNSEKYNDFLKKANDNEGIEEGYQMDYLKFSIEWLKLYIKDDSMEGKLSEKDKDNYLKQIEQIYDDRSRYIKNIYLSRGFNLGNFVSVELKPEISLPLYGRIKLAVSDKDRKAESASGQLLAAGKGLGSVLFAGAEKGKVAQAQNKAIFNVLTKLIGAGVTTVGGKEAGRKYNKGVEAFSKTGVAKELSLTTDTVKEDMLSASDSPSLSGNSPGANFQVPQQMPTDMDTMSLAGPGKSKKKEKKKKPQFSPILNSGKIMKFDQFIKGR